MSSTLRSSMSRQLLFGTLIQFKNKNKKCTLKNVTAKKFKHYQAMVKIIIKVLIAKKCEKNFSKTVVNNTLQMKTNTNIK